MAMTRFFRTFKDGQPRTIALSEEAAWRSLGTYWGFKEEERNRWSVQAEQRDVPCVNGTLHYWGDDGVSLPHVHWVCPKCGEEQHTDIEPGDSSPAIWYCGREGTADVFLVSWHRTSMGNESAKGSSAPPH